MSEMPDYDSSAERPKGQQSSVEMGAEHGVSEADKEANKGWAHRSQIARGSHEKDKQGAISATVNERRQGKAHRQIEETPSSHEQQQKERPKSDNHGETSKEDCVHGRPLTDKEKAAMKFGEYWPTSEKREFLEEDTLLEAEQFGWEI